MATASKITTMHCCISLDKLLELTLKGSVVLSNEDGSDMPEIEVYKLVKQEKAKGYTHYSGCDNRDKIGKCKGHQE